MRGSSSASGPEGLVCPFCERDRLRPYGIESVRCPYCSGVLGGAMLWTLRRMAALPDAMGSHACECGHPEMRRLSDGVFHCPACGSEVLPLEAPSALSGPMATAGRNGRANAPSEGGD